MAHIKVPAGAPGIVGPMQAYPATAKVLNALADQLLTQESASLSKMERETIAAYVSYLNHCVFCSESHGAAADYHAQKPGLSRTVWQDMQKSELSAKMKALLQIAAKVQKDARTVSSADVAAATALGATDQDIHDTVLIAAAFCMFNRYVDGLGTSAPPAGDKAYAQMGQMLATRGYRNSI